MLRCEAQSSTRGGGGDPNKIISSAKSKVAEPRTPGV